MKKRKKLTIYIILLICSFVILTNGVTIRLIGMIYDIDRLEIIGFILMFVGVICSMASSFLGYSLRKNKWGAQTTDGGEKTNGQDGQA